MKQALSDVRLPPERFFWAELDVSSLPRSITPKRRAKQFGYLFEPLLPVPLESVHVSYLPTDGARVVACAMAHDELSTVRNAASLGPESSPPFLECECQQINLLCDRHEPKPLRTKRARLAVLTAAAMILLTGVVMVGVQRRIASSGLHARGITNAQLVLYDRVLPDVQSTQPPELRVLAELRQLERTRETRVESSADISPALADLLAVWPDDLPIQSHSIVLSEISATISATAPDHESAQSLADALGKAALWRTSNPQVQPSRGAVQLTLRLDRVENRKEPGQ